MKKVWILFLCICLLTALAVPALAAGSATVSVSASTVHRGDTFTLTVSLSGVTACRSGGVEVSHDSKFELTGGEWLISDTVLSNFEVSSKDGVFALDSEKALSGKVLKLTFKAKSNAEFASGNITVKFSLNGGGGEISKTVKVTVSCNHKYGKWSEDGSKHSRKCSICGTVDTKAHEYDHGCDTDCNACGAKRTTTHDFSADWTGDETGHYHACTVCGEKTEFSAHVPGEPAGEYTDQVCTVCNFVLAPALGHQHKYDGTYLTDGFNHWTKCLGCGEETPAEMHSFDDDCDDVCDTCGYLRGVLHQESKNWLADAENHWKVCEACQDRLREGKHIWDGGTVIQEAKLNQPGKMEYRCGVCDATRTGELPALTLAEAFPWWAWLCIGAGGGILLTAGIGLTVILCNSRRKSGGRFSN